MKKGMTERLPKPTPQNPGVEPTNLPLELKRVKGPNILVVMAFSIFNAVASPVLTTLTSYVAASVATPYITNQFPKLPESIRLTNETEEAIRREIKMLEEKIKIREIRQQELGGGPLGAFREWLEKGGPSPKESYLNTLRAKKTALEVKLRTLKSINDSELLKQSVEMRNFLVFWFLFIVFTIYLKQYIDAFLAKLTESWKRKTTHGQINENFNKIVAELTSLQNKLEEIKLRQLNAIPTVADDPQQILRKMVEVEEVIKEFESLKSRIENIESKLATLSDEETNSNTQTKI